MKITTLEYFIEDKKTKNVLVIWNNLGEKIEIEISYNTYKQINRMQDNEDVSNL